jgi:hypothetical protein
MIYPPVKRLALLLVLALFMTALPWATAEGSFDAIVTVEAMKVYAQAKPHDVLATLPLGTVVTVQKWSGKAALILYGNITGVAKVSEMSRLTSTAAPTATYTPAPAAGQAMVTNRQTRVYVRPSATSRFVNLDAGVSVQVLSQLNVGTVRGLSVSGLIAAQRDVCGWQLSGLTNNAREIAGVQTSIGMNLADDVKGVQVGLLNVTKRLKGVQIGLLNINRAGWVFPLINVSF